MASKSALKLPAPNPCKNKLDKYFLGKQFFSYYVVVASLNDFQEQSGPILHVFSENLQQIAIIVVVDKDVKLLKNELIC